MKNSKYLLLCYSFLAFSVHNTSAYEIKETPPWEKLRDATTWDELKQTDSDTVNATSEHCQSILIEARKNNQISLERLFRSIPQLQTVSSMRSHIEGTVNEIAETMKICSRKIDDQLEDLGKKYLKRLETVIHTAKSIDAKIAAELQKVYNSKMEDDDKLAVTIRQFVTTAYNPLSIIKPVLQKSLSYQSNNMGELQKIAKNEIKSLSSKMGAEINDIENTVVGVLNRISKGMTIMKVVYASLKRIGQLPPEWPPQYTIQILQQGALMSKTASQDDDENVQQVQIQQTARQQQLSIFKADEQTSSEEDTEEEEEEDDLGCIPMFSRIKRKMLKQLILTITEIKAQESVKDIDVETYRILKEYGSVFHELNSEINSKIIDYTHSFIKLYKMNLDIMGLINPGMKTKMEIIYLDTTVDKNNPFYAQIQKYLTRNYVSDEKIDELYRQIETSIQGAKTLREIQKKISKELVTVTTALGKDLEDMKMVTIYILEEMREGVLALKQLRDNSNIRGYLYYFNYYDGKDDLKQLRKLIMILNMLNIDQMLDREIEEIISGIKMNTCREITESLMREINEDLRKFDVDIKNATSVTAMQKIVAKYVNDYNKMMRNYIHKTRKLLKHIVTTYVTVHEELIIIMRRKNIENVEEVEDISTSADSDTEISFIQTYMAENVRIDVESYYGATFNFESSSSMDQTRAAVKNQLHSITDSMTSELNQLDMQIENAIDKIITETKNVETIKRELMTSESYTIAAGQFTHLGTVMSLSNILQIFSALNNVKKENHQEVNKTFNNAKEQIESIKIDAEQAIKESTQITEVKIQIEVTKISIRSTLLDLGSEIKEDIAEVSNKFVDFFGSFISKSEDQQLEDKIQNMEVQMEIVGEELKEYLTNSYANTVLTEFGRCLIHSTPNSDIEESKNIALQSLNETMQKIQSDMDVVKTETIANVIEKISRAIDLIENFENVGKSVLQEEEIMVLATAKNLINVLQDFLSTDSTYNEEEMRNLLNTARESITQEYTTTIRTIQTLTNNDEIDDTASASVQLIEETYEDLRNDVKGQLEGLAATLTESYECAMSNVLGVNDELELTMQNIINGQITATPDTTHENAINFMSSGIFRLSRWVSSHFENIQRNDEGQFEAANETAIHQLGQVHHEIENGISSMEEMVICTLQDFRESSTIIQSIEDNSEHTLNENQINVLTNSFQLIKALTQPIAPSTSSNEFNDAKRLIQEELNSTLKSVENLADSTIITEEITKTVENYGKIYENLRSATESIFTQRTSDFFALYNSIKENAIYNENSEIENIIVEITTKKETLQASQQYTEFETFIESDKFKSTSLVFNLFSSFQQTIGVEQLVSVTSEIEKCISEMENANQFVQEVFQEGTRILSAVENGETTLNQEEILKITETILISEKLSPEYSPEDSNYGTRSLDQEDLTQNNIFSEAQTSVLSEFDNAIKLIETTTDDNLIEQIMTTSIEFFSTIFDDLKQKVKDKMNDDCESYQNSLAIAINISESNSEVQSTLQNIAENTKNLGPFLDENFSRASNCINSEGYQSSNVVNMMYEQIHNESNTELSMTERSAEELRLITADVCQTMTEIEFTETYTHQHFQRGTEILSQIREGFTGQLSEEDIQILATNTQITQMLQTSPANSVKVEYISESQNAINNELETSIEQIQSLTDEVNAIEIITTTIQSTDTIFNDLKNNFKNKVVEKALEFKENYDSTIETLHQQGNSQLVDILENTTIESNAENEIIYTEFQSYIENNLYTSTTAVEDLFQTLQLRRNSVENNIDWSLDVLQTISISINENINQMETTAVLIENTLQQGFEVIEGILNQQISELTEEQINKICLSKKFEQTLQPKSLESNQVTDKEFEETETFIKKEFEGTIGILETLSTEVAINEVIATTIANADSAFNTLKEKVHIEITTSVTIFEEIVTTFETICEEEGDTEKLQTINEIIENEINIQADESFIQIETFITGDIFNSNSPVKLLYDNIEQSTELNITEQSIERIRSLDTQVVESIDTMDQVKKNIMQYIKQGTEIIETIQNSTSEFTENQVQIISKCHELSNIILHKEEPSVIENQQIRQIDEESSNVKLAVNEVYENAVKQIDTLTDDTNIDEIITTSLQNNENIYNNLRNTIETKITETVIQFKETFEATVQIVKENDNEELANILQDITTTQANTDKIFEKFESFTKSDNYRSENFVQHTFEELQQNSSQLFDNLREQGKEQLKLMNDKLNENIDMLQEMETYSVDNLQQGVDILQVIQNDTSNQLKEEQIQTLALSNAITTTITTTLTTNEESNTTSEESNTTSEESNTTSEESNTWSIIGSFWSNNTPEIEFNDVKSEMTEVYSATIETIKSLNMAEEIQPVVNDCVENSNTVYSSLLEKVHTKITETSNSFTEAYQTVINTAENQEDKNMQKLIEEVNNNARDLNSADEYIKFETFVTSNNYSSTNVIVETYEIIQHENQLEGTDNSLVENTIQQLSMLSEKTEEYIDEMSNISAYVNDHLERATEILNTVQNDEKVELNQEEIDSLSLSQKIIQTLSNTPDTLDASTVNQLETTTQIEISIDISTTITTINEELDTSIKAIESAIDAQSVQQIVSDCVQVYDEVYTNLRAKVQTQITDIFSTFGDEYAETLTTTLQNEDTVELAAEDQEALIQFETFIASDEYKSPHPVEDIFNSLQQDAEISSIPNINERGVQDLKVLNLQLTDNINIMQSTASYVAECLQNSSNILQTLESSASDELSTRQVQELTISQKIIETLSTSITSNFELEDIGTNISTSIPTTTLEDQELLNNNTNAEPIVNEEELQETNTEITTISFTNIDSTTAITTIQENCEKVIDKIKSATGTEEVQAAVTESVLNYDTIYNDVRHTIQMEIDINLSQFNNIFQSLTNGNEEESRNEIVKTLQNTPEQQVSFEADENFTQFQQFVQSNQFQSTSLANDLYLEIRQNENQFSSNENERGEEEIQFLSTQITETITMLEQTKEYVVQQVSQGSEVLQLVHDNQDYSPTEEEINKLSITQQIVSTLTSITMETTTIQIAESSNILDNIQEDCQNAVDEIKSLNDVESIKEVVTETVDSYETTLNSLIQSMEQKIDESLSGFDQDYDEVMKNIGQTGNDQIKDLIENSENLEADEGYLKFEAYINSDSYQLASSIVQNIHDQVEQNEELTSIADINERYAEELEVISRQVTQNVVEVEAITSYVEEHLEKGSTILHMLEEDQNMQLTVEQAHELALSRRIQQALASRKGRNTSQQIPTQEIPIQEIPTQEISVPETPIQEIPSQQIAEIDFQDTEISMDMKFDEIIEKINTLNEEDELQELVRQNVQECGEIYNSLQNDVRANINSNSASFTQKFEATVNNLTEDSPLRGIFEGIIGHNISLPSDAEQEYQNVLSEMKNENIMSTSAVENIYNTITEELEANSNSQQTEVKERCINEVRSLNAQVKENIAAMKHIDQYVSQNLQNGERILEMVENETQIDALDAQQVNNLSICASITEQMTTQSESSTWNTFLSFATVIISIEDESSSEQETSAEVDDRNSTTPEDENLTTDDWVNVDHVEDESIIIQSTRSIMQTTEIIKEIFITTEEEEEEEEEETSHQCITQNNVTSVRAQIRKSDTISINDLLINWSTSTSEGANTPSTCRDLTWNLQNYGEEDQRIVEQIVEVLVVARDIIVKLLQYQQSRINFYKNIDDILVVFVNCAENIDDVLGQLSSVISQNISKLLEPLIRLVENEQTIQREWQQASGNLDDEFQNASKILFSLMIHENTDIQRFIDDQFADTACNSLSTSKEITIEKFTKLNDTIDKILNNIDCVTLIAIDTILSGKATLQSNEKNLEIIKRNQLLYQIICEINNI